MKSLRLKYKLLLGAFFISLVMLLTSMLAVSVVISRQYHNQSNALLNKASRIITDNLNERKTMLLNVSRQMASQKNLGSTIWYLGQYAHTEVDRDILFNTYQQLVMDLYKMGKVAKLSQVAIYDAQGRLIAFSSFDTHLVGFAEHGPDLAFQVARLKEGLEFSKQNLQPASSISGIDSKLAGTWQDSAQYAIVGNALSIESRAPILGEMFDPTTGKPETRQLATVVVAQSLDRDFADYLMRLTDIRINLFTPQGYSSGSMPAYRNPDWQGTRAGNTPAFNQTRIAGENFFQILIPLYTDSRLVGTIAALQSDAAVHQNIREMVRVLIWIAAVCLLIMAPFAWYLADSISRPLRTLSRMFRDVASGKQTLHEKFDLTNRNDELGELTGSFIAMNQAIKQKIEQINEINATLEDKIEERTRQLRAANEALIKLASHDALTGLPNRQLLSDRLTQSLVAAKRDKSHVALMFIDLDEFKPINDTYGHAIGDLILTEAAKRIQNCIRGSDTVSRVGGDEFIVLLPIVESQQQALIVAEKIRQSLKQPFVLSKNLHISCSVGIALYPEHGSDENTLLKHADLAMYDAKRSGRNAVKLFHVETDDPAHQSRLEF